MGEGAGRNLSRVCQQVSVSNRASNRVKANPAREMAAVSTSSLGVNLLIQAILSLRERIKKTKITTNDKADERVKPKAPYSIIKFETCRVKQKPTILTTCDKISESEDSWLLIL